MSKADSASLARENGWKVGTVLYGQPIVRDGRMVECGRTLIITAIGLQCVLGITHLDVAVEGAWSREHSMEFGAREWGIAPDDGSASAHPVGVDTDEG